MSVESIVSKNNDTMCAECRGFFLEKIENSEEYYKLLSVPKFSGHSEGEEISEQRRQTVRRVQNQQIIRSILDMSL